MKISVCKKITKFQSTFASLLLVIILTWLVCLWYCVILLIVHLVVWRKNLFYILSKNPICNTAKISDFHLLIIWDPFECYNPTELHLISWIRTAALVYLCFLKSDFFSWGKIVWNQISLVCSEIEKKRHFFLINTPGSFYNNSY